MEYNNDSRPPYPPFGPDRYNMPPPQPQQPLPPHMMPPPTSSPSSQYPDPYGYGSWHQQPQPQPPMQPQLQPQPHAHTGRINDAVNSAFSDAERPSYLSPEVVSQITANVIQQLKMTGLDGNHGMQDGQQLQPPGPSPGPPPGPSYTPSPTSQFRVGHDAYPPPPPPPPEYQYSPRPASGEPIPQPGPQYAPPPMEGQDSTGSQSSGSSSKSESRSPTPSRDSGGDSDPDLTTLEKIWGKLFEGDKPTRRLGQLLRGIAVHLVCIFINLGGDFERKMADLPDRGLCAREQPRYHAEQNAKVLRGHGSAFGPLSMARLVFFNPAYV